MLDVVHGGCFGQDDEKLLALHVASVPAGSSPETVGPGACRLIRHANDRKLDGLKGTKPSVESLPNSSRGLSSYRVVWTIRCAVIVGSDSHVLLRVAESHAKRRSEKFR